MEHITNSAKTRGMRVNHAKTCLMCFSAASSFEASAEISGPDGSVIKSVDFARFLGVTIDSDLTFGTHIEDTRKKVRARAWALNALREASFSESELVKVYETHVRPAAEYASVVWGSMITAQQGLTLERQQNQALKYIFGFDVSASKMRERAGFGTEKK